MSQGQTRGPDHTGCMNLWVSTSRAWAISCAFLIAVWPAQAQAQAQYELQELDAPEEIAPIKVYRVGVERRSYWPRYGVSEQQFRGYAQELLDTFAADSGYRFEYILLPGDQLLQRLVMGDVDLRYPDSPSWAVAEKRGQPLSYSRAVDFSVVGVNVPPQRVGQKELKTLGMLLGFKPKQFKQQVEEGELIIYPTATLADLATLAGEGLVDGIYGDPYVVRYHLRKQGFADGVLAFDYSEPHSLHNYSLSTLEYPELMSEFDRWFKNHYDLVLKLRRAHDIYEF